MLTPKTDWEIFAERTVERLTALEVDVAVIRSNYATKEDVAKVEYKIVQLESTLLKWFIGTAVALAAVAFAAAKYIR